MAHIRLRLREALQQRGTNPFALARAMGDQRKAVTLYRLTNPNKPVTRIDLRTLAEILTALEKVSGQPVEIGELLEVVDREPIKARLIMPEKPGTKPAGLAEPISYRGGKTGAEIIAEEREDRF